MSSDDHVAIIGAGIIGCATAYYLSRTGGHVSPDQIHIIDSTTELFSSASGKAGGFLAEDWFGPATASLGSLSYRLHRELAEQNDGYDRWGYSRGTGMSLRDADAGVARGEDWLRTNGSRAEAAAAGVHESTSKGGGEAGEHLPTWLLRSQGDVLESISEEGGTAQVDPLRLCEFLLRESTVAGVRLHQPAQVLSLAPSGQDGKSTTLGIRDTASGSESEIPCTHLLLAAGAWTPRVFTTLYPRSPQSLPITSLAGHSLVVRSPRWNDSPEQRTDCHAVFTTLPGEDFSPEIFSRVGREIYVAGLNDAAIPLPARPEEAVIDGKCIEKLRGVAKKLLGSSSRAAERALGKDVDDLEVVRQGLCFRPVTSKGTPIVCRVQDRNLGPDGSGLSGGLYVAAGHGPWGISHSLGTGLVMAEMLQGKKLSANISRLSL